MAYTRPRSRGEVALSQHRRIRKIGGLARGCEPEGTADELCKRKEADAAKPEPPGEIIAEALKFLRADRTGRWHVRAPEGPWHRDGLYGWKISDSEVERLLRLGASFIDSGQTTTSAFWANQQPTASHGQQSSWPVWIRLRLEVRAAAIV